MGIRCFCIGSCVKNVWLVNNDFMRIYLALTLCIFAISVGFAQSNNTLCEKNVFLFAESHFVGEKYDVIQQSIFSIIDTTKNSDTVHLFLELPTSFEYVIYRLKEFGDTTFFKDYYHNLYDEKKPPSNYWVDFRSFITTFIKNCQSRNIEWHIRCIDIEKNFRSTAYVLNHFNNDLDSLLSQKYVKEDSINRSYLISKIDLIQARKKLSDAQVYYLNRISESLNIKCLHCQKRDSLMYSNFRLLTESINDIIFGKFGYMHLLISYTDSMSNTNMKSNQYKPLYSDMVPFYGLFSEDLKRRSYRIGIIAFTIVKPNSFFRLEQNYEEFITEDERNYLEQMFGDSNVLKLQLKDYNECLPDLSKKIDHLILFNESIVNW